MFEYNNDSQPTSSTHPFIHSWIDEHGQDEVCRTEYGGAGNVQAQLPSELLFFFANFPKQLKSLGVFIWLVRIHFKLAKLNLITNNKTEAVRPLFNRNLGRRSKPQSWLPSHQQGTSVTRHWCLWSLWCIGEALAAECSWSTGCSVLRWSRLRSARLSRHRECARGRKGASLLLSASVGGDWVALRRRAEGSALWQLKWTHRRREHCRCP